MGKRSKNLKKKKVKKKKRKKINSYLLILGLIILIPPLFLPNKEIRSENITKIEISLHSNIEIIKGTKKDYSYRFWSKEYKSEFVIDKGSTPNYSYALMEDLKENDKLTISIKNKNRVDLNNKTKSIPKYSMCTKESNIFSLKEFNKYNKMYEFRLNIIMGFLGLLMIINSFSILSKHQNYYLVGGFAVVVLLMRIFNFGIYINN